MKKFLKNWWYIIFLGICTIFLLTLLSGCTIMKTIDTYQKYYPGFKQNESVIDVYQQLKEHQVDSLPLNKWLTLQANNDDGYILQKTVSAKEDEKTSWKFVYTKHVILDSTFYSIRVYVSTKNKRIQKFYGR
jgi:uncharacterized protein YceK